jgi:hypothetical protein
MVRPTPENQAFPSPQTETRDSKSFPTAVNKASFVQKTERKEDLGRTKVSPAFRRKHSPAEGLGISDAPFLYRGLDQDCGKDQIEIRSTTAFPPDTIVRFRALPLSEFPRTRGAFVVAHRYSRLPDDDGLSLAQANQMPSAMLRE